MGGGVIFGLASLCKISAAAHDYHTTVCVKLCIAYFMLFFITIDPSAYFGTQFKEHCSM